MDIFIDTDNEINEVGEITVAAQQLLADEAWEELGTLLESVPAFVIQDNRRLRYAYARWLLHVQRISDGIVELEGVSRQAVAAEDWYLALDSYLLLAKLHQGREAIALAAHYVELAEGLAEKHPPTSAAEEARFALGIGRLYPDLGDNRKTVVWCKKALRLYEEVGDREGKIEALWLLSVANCYLGSLDQAKIYVERALYLNAAAQNVDEVQRLFLLNVEAHVALYAGQVDEGLNVLEEAAPLSEKHPVCKPSLYLATAEGGLHREAGDLDASLRAYERAEEIMEALGDRGFRPWLTMERSWTQLLTGQAPAAVRSTLLSVADLQNEATRRSLKVHLAVLDLLEQRYHEALDRLEDVLEQFEAAGELVAAFAVRIYLAYTYSKRGDRESCHTSLSTGLEWAEATGVDGFPMFWYPPIVAEACAEALRADIHPDHVEAIFVRRLGEAGVPALLSLLETESPKVRRRARSIVAAVGGAEVADVLDEISAEAVAEAIFEHLREGRLAMGRLADLEERLRTAEHYDRSNWTRVAVFGYYVTGDFTRQEVAERVHLSESTVKNHITGIRNTFGIVARGVERLRDVAVREGFVTKMGTF